MENEAPLPLRQHLHSGPGFRLLPGLRPPPLESPGIVHEEASGKGNAENVESDH